MSVGNLKYTAWNAHAPYRHLWPVRLYNILPHYLIKGTIFGRKEKLLSIKCVFWFSLQLLSETFLILRKNEQYMIKSVYWTSCKVPVDLQTINSSLKDTVKKITPDVASCLWFVCVKHVGMFHGISTYFYRQSIQNEEKMHQVSLHILTSNVSP